MGVHRHGSTPADAVTPICNECGTSLCWDISIDEYEWTQAFWDDWICRECNGGTPRTRLSYMPIVCIEEEPVPPIVLNQHVHGRPDWAVYVGRGSKWGNPFRIDVDGPRAEVIAKYKRWIADQHHLLRDLHELKGKSLVCFCAPADCHADFLLWLAELDRAALVAWWRKAAV